MRGTIEHDGQGRLAIRFRFDRRLVDLVKTLPRRRWIATEKLWRVPEEDVVAVVDLLDAHGFAADDATRELYAALGGTRSPRAHETEPAPPATGGTLPGLFDEPLVAARASTSDATAEHWTVSALNRHVGDALAAAFPRAVWIVGEISGFNKSAHRRFVGFQLVERDGLGEEVSQVRCVLFPDVRREFERALERAGDPFRLEDDITVRLRGRVELYEPWGQYRVVAEELDVGYTVGEAARRREEIIRRLVAERLHERNPALELPTVPLAIGVVTSLGSDAYNDVVRTFQESGYAFRLTVHGARVQGRSTEPSVLNALDRLASRAERLDAVLICRGGGSRADLAWFDSEALGRAVAAFPIPVIAGIGHEQDRSVLDAVARSAKTPTAAAAYVVEIVRSFEARLVEGLSRAAERAAGRVARERDTTLERARRIARATIGAVVRERRDLDHLRRRVVAATRGALVGARATLDASAPRLARAVSARIAERAVGLDGAGRRLRAAARRGVEAATAAIEGAAGAIPPRAARVVERETERLHERGRRLHALDPRRVVERGYAILRTEDTVVSTISEVAAADAVVAEVRDGFVEMRPQGARPRSDENRTSDGARGRAHRTTE